MHKQMLNLYMTLCLINTLSFVKASCLPAFDNLIHLKLVLHDCYHWELLAELLKRSPNLECLVLEHKQVRCIFHLCQVLPTSSSLMSSFCSFF